MAAGSWLDWEDQQKLKQREIKRAMRRKERLERLRIKGKGVAEEIPLTVVYAQKYSLLDWCNQVTAMSDPPLVHSAALPSCSGLPGCPLVCPPWPAPPGLPSGCSVT